MGEKEERRKREGRCMGFEKGKENRVVVAYERKERGGIFLSFR